MPSDQVSTGPAAFEHRIAGAASAPLRRIGAAFGKAVAVALVLVWSIGPITMIVMAAFTPERDIFAVGPRRRGMRPSPTSSTFGHAGVTFSSGSRTV